MSSYDAGRCRRTIDAMDAGLCVAGMRCDHIIADAIDRLAADVAAVKGAACDRNGWPIGWLIEVDRLIRLRDEARAEVEKLKESRDAANRLYGATLAEVERLKRDGIQAPDDLGILRDAHGLSERCKELASRIAMQQIEARAEKVKAELERQPPAAPQPAAPPSGWLTDRERRAVAYFAQVCRDDLVPDGWTDNAGVLLSLLARAGSPPVVEVPAMVFGSGSYEMQKRYRAAMDRAGVAWKEVGRE